MFHLLKMTGNLLLVPLLDSSVAVIEDDNTTNDDDDALRLRNFSSLGREKCITF